LPGKAPFTEHCQHRHEGEKQKDDLGNHALEPKAGERGPVFDTADCVIHDRGPKPGQKPLLLAELAELHLVTKAVFHHRGHMAKAVHETLINPLLAKEHLAREQIGIIRQLRAAADGSSIDLDFPAVCTRRSTP